MTRHCQEKARQTPFAVRGGRQKYQNQSLAGDILVKAHMGAVCEKGGQCSRITLEEQDGKAFPVMLDFLCSGKLDASTDKAVALRSLVR